VEQVCHAGVQKKLKRNLKPALLALAMWDEYALGIFMPQKITSSAKPILNMMPGKTALYCWASGTSCRGSSLRCPIDCCHGDPKLELHR
jgi:hypothetical protein